MSRSLRYKSQQGMALIEGLIAILIFSIGILSLVGLQAMNLRHANDAKYRVDASFLANETLGMMWADRANLDVYEKEEQVPALPNGMRKVDVVGNRVTITITWRLPGESAAHSHVVVANING